MNELEKVTQEIIRRHDTLMSSARRTVEEAIKIGKLLTVQKEKMEHGEYLPWIKTLPFSRQTADNYVGLNTYADKMPTVSNLQEAYKQLESLEDNAGDIRKKLDGAGAEEPDEDGVLYEAMVAKAVENMADLLDKLADIRIEANKLAGREGGEKPEKKEAKGKEEKAE